MKTVHHNFLGSFPLSHYLAKIDPPDVLSRIFLSIAYKRQTSNLALLLVLVMMTSLCFPVTGYTAALDKTGPVLTGLIAYWSFDACNADDSGPYKNHGVIQGNPQCIDGVHGKALSFDGTDDFILVPNADSLNPVKELSLAAWYRPSRAFAGNGDNAIVQKPYPAHEAPYYQYHLGVNGNAYWPDRILRTQGRFDARVAIQGASVLQTTENDFWKPGQWYCLVSTYDQQQLKLFADGKLVGQTNNPGPLNTYPTPLTIAKAYNINRPGVDYTPGDMDEIQIYDRPLTEQEIRQICRIADTAKDGTVPSLAQAPQASEKSGILIEEQALTTIAPDLVKREGQTLRLRLKNGQFHNLKNREESNEDGGRDYHFQAHLPDLHSYLVWISESEGNSLLLVDTSTGAETEIWGNPVISPDHKRFLTFSMDMEASFIANGIQIWNDQVSKFVSEYDQEYNDWGPSEVKWIDNSTISITKNIPDTKTGGNYREAIAYLKLDGKGRWLLDETAKDRWERVVMGSGVRLRANPDPASPITARLSLGTVLTVAQLATDQDQQNWYQVQTPDHLQGWVAGPQTVLFDKNHPENHLPRNFGAAF
ncbi:LamG-like jellyroll fold domain-containing protein [Methylovulum sp.]|uniref:LamG-like jellyroll fold domain-containing protein n=1 Tax=Methylovulum sp. TaxID=1916980 RepID=UPI00261A9E3B|nr:LamG-like jellyroll fold domain-containing protein [Methylovulum sp.]MDD5126306.1 SH3 domain-containing protein [Methylovulum sp.]